MSNMFGIDISRWQGDFNLSKAVKEDKVEFVIIKGGGGDSGLYVDSQFVNNYNKAKKLGLPVGCYWFSKAMTLKEAEQEAEYFYQNVLKGRQFELPIYLDVENKDQLALGQRKVTDIAKTWLNYLEKKKFYVGIYSSKYHVTRKFFDDELQAYTHWIAQWSKECTYPKKNNVLGMWQFGGETNVIRSNKIVGVVCDQDYMLRDFPTIIKTAGLNGFGVKEPEVVDTDYCEVTLPRLHKGSTGGHVKTLQILLNAYFNAKLEVDGNFGPKTRASVVSYQKATKLDPDGWVGPITWSQLLK